MCGTDFQKWRPKKKQKNKTTLPGLASSVRSAGQSRECVAPTFKSGDQNKTKKNKTTLAGLASSVGSAGQSQECVAPTFKSGWADIFVGSAGHKWVLPIDFQKWQSKKTTKQQDHFAKAGIKCHVCRPKSVMCGTDFERWWLKKTKNAKYHIGRWRGLGLHMMLHTSAGKLDHLQGNNDMFVTHSLLCRPEWEMCGTILQAEQCVYKSVSELWGTILQRAWSACDVAHVCTRVQVN